MNIVARAEALKNARYYSEAANLYLDAINITNINAKNELKEAKPPDKSPYCLRLHLLRLMCLADAGLGGTSAFRNECRQIINEYRKQSTGKIWTFYIGVYQQLLNHFANLNSNNKMEEVLFEVLDSEPRYLPFLTYFFVNSDFRITTVSKINNAIKHYENSNAKTYPNVEYMKLKFVEKKGGDSFTAAYNFINRYPRFEHINEVVKTLGNSIDRSKPEQIEKYKNALIVLAIKQPYDKEDTSKIAFILNEINKQPTK